MLAQQLRRFFEVALVLWFFLPAYAGTKDRAHEQLNFSAEEADVENPVPVPDDVLDILRLNKMVRNAMEDKAMASERPPQTWFSAALVHLGRNNLVDLVVAAKGPLAGGNVVTFWVFLATAQGHHLVMTAPVHHLQIEKTRHNGYRDIKLSSMSATRLSTVLCRFNGEQYVEYRSSLKVIR